MSKGNEQLSLAVNECPDNLPSIDWASCLKYAVNDAEFAEDMLKMFVNELPATQQMIQQAFDEKDQHTLHMQVHKLNGASSYCGVLRLKRLLMNMEIKINMDGIHHISELLEQLNNEIALVLSTYQQQNFKTS